MSEVKLELTPLEITLMNSHKALRSVLKELNPDEEELHSSSYRTINKMLLVLENEYFRLTKKALTY